MNNENELKAALVTIERCREISGCPAGVDLQDWVKQLAAENVGLKEAIPQLKNIDYKNENMDDVALAEEIGFNAAVMAMHRWIPKTPATDRIVAGIKADGVEMVLELISHTKGMLYADSVKETLSEVSSRLREGAK